MMLFKTERTPTYLQDLVRNHNHNEDAYRFQEILRGSDTIAEDLNRGKRALQIHSGKDYKRNSPLLESLELGVTSVEIDAWYIDGIDYDLFIGSHKFGLTSYKTLNSLYLGTLDKILDQINSKSIIKSSGLRGVFYDDPKQTFQLVIDVKNYPSKVFEVLQRNLAIFQLKNYLTSYDTVLQKWHHGPITVVLTGDIPYDEIKNQTVRNCFIEAPLSSVFDSGNKFQEMYPPELSVSTSGSLFQLTGSQFAGDNDDGLSVEQISTLSKYIDQARNLGLRVRISGIPTHGSIFSSNDASFRYKIWSQLIDLKVDALDCDYIKECYGFLRASVKWNSRLAESVGFSDVKGDNERDFEMLEIKESHRLIAIEDNAGETITGPREVSGNDSFDYRAVINTTIQDVGESFS